MDTEQATMLLHRSVMGLRWQLLAAREFAAVAGEESAVTACDEAYQLVNAVEDRLAAKFARQAVAQGVKL